MVKFVSLVVALFLLASCGAGDRVISLGNTRLQPPTPTVAVDRYEAVVFPAGVYPAGSVAP